MTTVRTGTVYIETPTVPTINAKAALVYIEVVVRATPAGWAVGMIRMGN